MSGFFDGQAVMRNPCGPGSVTSYTGTAGNSAALPGGDAVFLWCTTDAWVKVGVGAVATATDFPLPAYTPIFLPAPPGSRVSAIQMSAGGNLYVCPVTI